MNSSTPQLLPHHSSDGGFTNPWVEPRDRSIGRLLKWMWSRWRNGIPPNPRPNQLPRSQPQITYPRAPADETRITWIGHASALLQHGGANILTDPHFSERAAPLQKIGPRRFVPPGVSFDELPPIDGVVLSHDHYDHLDDGTVRRLHQRFGDRIRWFTPLGYRKWLGKRGISNVVELDWWEAAEMSTAANDLVIRALPAQHWTRRGWFDPKRLWASWSIESASAGKVYFGGDSGYFPGFVEIGRRIGPFRAALIPIGAYDPRWFMAHDHMNPEEAVRTYEDLGGEGLFVGIHWGTFRLTDEDPLEPPARAMGAWKATGRDDEGCWMPRHGETRILSLSAIRYPLSVDGV